jgi:hypothetical protein
MHHAHTAKDDEPIQKRAYEDEIMRSSPRRY